MKNFTTSALIYFSKKFCSQKSSNWNQRILKVFVLNLKLLAGYINIAKSYENKRFFSKYHFLILANENCPCKNFDKITKNSDYSGKNTLI